MILASKTSVINAGTIDVSGGDGGPSNFASGFGGGGGGGIAHLLAPAITTAGGSIILGGGAGGTNAIPVSATLRSGGNGGGGSGGDGGDGAQVPPGSNCLLGKPVRQFWPAGLRAAVAPRPDLAFLARLRTRAMRAAGSEMHCHRDDACAAGFGWLRDGVKYAGIRSL